MRWNSSTVSPTFNLVLLSMAKVEESNSQKSFGVVQKFPITCELLQDKCAFFPNIYLSFLRGIICAVWLPPGTVWENCTKLSLGYCC